MSDAEMRAAIHKALKALNVKAEAAIRRELADPFKLDPNERLQFEVCPHFYGIKLVQTEEEIVPDSVLGNVMPPQLRDFADAADLDLHDALGEELFPWLAERWEVAGGPQHYRPAYAFFHGGLSEPLYDLEQRRWYEVSEGWPDEE